MKRSWSSTLGALALQSALGLGAVAAWAGPAHALVTTTYDATKCYWDFKTETDSNGHAIFSRANGKITNVRTDGANATVHCPLIKTTSGPGITNDSWSDVQVAVQTNGADVECQVNIFDSGITDWNTGNLIEQVSAAAVTTGTMTIAPTFFSPSSWWTANGTSGNTASWYFFNLTCELPPGTGIGTYTSHETGTQQVSRIYSSMSCRTDASSKIDWSIRDDGNGAGGLIMGQAGNNLTPFVMDCPVPNNTVVDLAFGKAIGSRTFGCNLDNPNLAGLTWWRTSTVTDTEWPWENFREPGQPVISIPGTGTHNLDCGVNGAFGDSKIISYRAQPQPSRAGWVVSASVGGSPGNAIDNNPSTRWTTGTGQTSGQWYKIDLGSAKTFSQVTMDSGTDSNDYARSYAIYVSNDGVSWGSYVAAGGGINTFVSASFATKTARYIKIQLIGNFTSKWWSLHEVNVYN